MTIDLVKHFATFLPHTKVGFMQTVCWKTLLVI